jgi:hypothetical protein
MRQEPREVVASLDGYTVKQIDREAARRLIERYEYLGNVGKARHFVGLVAPGGELHGVAAFGHGPRGQIEGIIGSPALCLERGACVHYAPRNSASFLIAHACRLMFEISGVAIYFAYTDPEAGEYGAVYKAAGWVYLGQGLNGAKTQRSQRIYVLQPGRDPGDPTAWQTCRALRRGGGRLTRDEAIALGWGIMKRPCKGVYAICVGPEAKRWRKRIAARPYPKGVNTKPGLAVNTRKRDRHSPGYMAAYMRRRRAKLP